MRHLDPPPVPEHDPTTAAPSVVTASGTLTRVTVPATGIEPTSPVPIVTIEAPEPVLVLGGVATSTGLPATPPTAPHPAARPAGPAGPPTRVPGHGDQGDVPLARLAPSLVTDAEPPLVDRRPELPPPSRFAALGGVDELRDLARHATNGVVIACLLLAAVPMALIGIRWWTADDDMPIQVIDGTGDNDGRFRATGTPTSSTRTFGAGTSELPAGIGSGQPTGPSRPQVTAPPPNPAAAVPAAAAEPGTTRTTLTHPATTVLVDQPSGPPDGGEVPGAPDDGSTPTVLDNAVTRPAGETTTITAPPTPTPTAAPIATTTTQRTTTTEVTTTTTKASTTTTRATTATSTTGASTTAPPATTVTAPSASAAVPTPTAPTTDTGTPATPAADG